MVIVCASRHPATLSCGPGVNIPQARQSPIGVTAPGSGVQGPELGQYFRFLSSFSLEVVTFDCRFEFLVKICVGLYLRYIFLV